MYSYLGVLFNKAVSVLLLRTYTCSVDVDQSAVLKAYYSLGNLSTLRH